MAVMAALAATLHPAFAARGGHPLKAASKRSVLTYQVVPRA